MNSLLPWRDAHLREMFTTQHLRGLFKTDAEMIPRGMPHPQISYWRCLRCVSYQRFQSFLGVGHKVLVLRHFLTHVQIISTIT